MPVLVSASRFSHLDHGSLPKFGELRRATRAHRGGDRIAVRRDTRLRRRATPPTMPPRCGTAASSLSSLRRSGRPLHFARLASILTPAQRLDLKQAARESQTDMTDLIREAVNSYTWPTTARRRCSVVVERGDRRAQETLPIPSPSPPPIILAGPQETMPCRES
jgi:hypothetical protein